MKWNFAGFASLLLVVAIDAQAPPADACGVKLTIKTSSPRKAVARTARPSHVLLLGNAPRRLERDLSAAGHDVETVSTASGAKRASYAVVIVDSNEQASEAHTKFADASVVVRSGDPGADLRSVEDRVSRTPVRTDVAGVVIAARTGRTPIAAGPPRDDHKVVAIKEPSEPSAVPAVAATPPTPPPDPTPVRPPTPDKPPTPAKPENVTTSTPKVEEVPGHKEPKPTVQKPSANAATEIHDELYFTLGSAKITNKARLAKPVKWLTDNADVHVVVEGHADPTGSADANMALSQVRAETVRDYLVSMGIDQSRIEVVPYGDTHIKYGRSDSRNRRVAIEAKK